MHASLEPRLEVGIILPLYVYPSSSESWKPLYDAATAHRNVRFVVIVNPNNGPGAGPLPDNNYIRELTVLNTHPNITTIGYVSSRYCRRDLNTVCGEIEVYASWHGYQDGNIQVQGIFLDETPSWWQKDATSTYLHAVHSCTEANFLSTPVIVHNPGARPALLPQNMHPEIAVIREDSAAQFTVQDITWTSTSTGDREKYAVIVYDVRREQMAQMVKDLRSYVKWLYLTEGSGYTALESLAGFCELVR